MTNEQASQVLNEANKNLHPLKFIGQYDSVSKWVPRTSSIYADMGAEIDFEHETTDPNLQSVESNSL